MGYGACQADHGTPGVETEIPVLEGSLGQEGSLWQWSYPWKEHWPRLRPYRRAPPRPQDQILSRSPPLAADEPPHARGSLPWAASAPRIRQHREGLFKGTTSVLGSTSLCPTLSHAQLAPIPLGVGRTVFCGATTSGMLYPAIVSPSICLEPSLQLQKSMIQAKPTESQSLAERWSHDPARVNQCKTLLS